MGTSNAEQLLRNPTLAEAVMKMLDQGESQRAISRETGVSTNTISALQKRPECLDVEAREQWRQETMAKCQTIASKALDRYSQALDMDEVKPASLPVHAAIMIDKTLALGQDTGLTGQQETQETIGNILNDLHKIACRSTVAVQVNHYHGSQGDSRETRVHDVTMETQETDG